MLARIAVSILAVVAVVPGARASDLGGTYTLRSGEVTLTLSLEQSRGGVRGTLTSTKGVTLTLAGTVEDGVASGTCTGAGAQSLFEAELEGGKLVLTLVELGPDGAAGSRSLEFERASPATARRPRPAEAGARPAAAPPRAAAGGGDLAAYFAGSYYSYSSGSTMYGGSGTERTVTLCPDGTYHDSYESSASGSGWGSAAQRGGGGRWSMQGDRARGLLLVVGADGREQRIPYEVLDKREGTIRFGGVTFAYAGAPRCP